MSRRTFKVLVCGGRDFKKWSIIFNHLKTLHEKHNITHIITGGADGADSYAKGCARELGIQTVECDANWNLYGKAAGPIRNRNMLDLQPDLVIAFPGGKGTASMKALAQQAGIEVIELESNSVITV